MLRSTSTLTIAVIAGLALAGAAGAQTKSATPTCGIETWSTDQMTYVMTPCTGGETQPSATAQSAKTPATGCGIETWSTDKMTYVTPPCATGVAEEKAGPSR